MAASDHHGSQFEETMLQRATKGLIGQNQYLHRGNGIPDNDLSGDLYNDLSAGETRNNRLREKIDSTLASNGSALSVMWPSDLYKDW